MMPVARSRERGGAGAVGRCAVAATDGDARPPSADERVGGDDSGGVARDAEQEGGRGKRGPASTVNPGEDTIDVEPDDGDGGGSVTLLTLVLTGARVSQKLVSNDCSATRKASEEGTQRGGPNPGGANGVDRFVEAMPSPPPQPVVARVPASDDGPPAASEGAALAIDSAVLWGGTDVDTSVLSSSDKSVGVVGDESTLSPGGLPRVGDTDMLDGIDSRAPGPSGTAGDGGVP